MKKITALFLTLLLLGSMAGCGTQTETFEVPELLEPVAVTVDTAVAYIDDIYNVSVQSAEVVPHVEGAWFTVNGVLDQMNVVIGDQVTEGQVLATLDNESLLDQIADLEDQIAHANAEGSYSDRLKEADIKLAKLNLEALERTLLATPEQIRAKEIAVEQLEADLKQSQEMRALTNSYRAQQLEDLKAKLSSNELKAPMSGTVVYMKQMQGGDSIRGFETIIYIADQSRLQISTDYISELDLRSVDQITAVIDGKEYAVTHVPMDTEEYMAKVLAGESMNSHFAVDDPAAKITAGQYVVLKMLDEYKEDVLVVPVNAIYRDERGEYVYRFVDGQRLRQDVTVGITTDLEAEITEGLEEGAIVYVQE